MNRPANPWNPEPSPLNASGAANHNAHQPADQAGRNSGGPQAPADATAEVPRPNAGAGVDVEAVWAAYQTGLNRLGRAESAAQEEHEAVQRAGAEAVHQAERNVAAATADRESLETELGLFEARVNRVLETTGVTPEGAGTGMITAQVDDVAGARATMAEITSELNRAAADLATARAAQTDRRRGLLATGIVALAAVTTLVWMNLLGTNTFATIAAVLLVFATTMLGRRRGPLAAGITAAITLAGVVLTVTLVGPILATIVLILAAVIVLIVLIRPRRRRPGLSRPASPNSGGSRV
ncbi:hypothetical protein ACFT2C_06030 [Promicromonospora sp. NPDC057138]|uniref:hypothetical protein n=1 Tax=Promicromonospora sp. NPDC057138 TaxID=3346031 RepID=UPI003639682B